MNITPELKEIVAAKLNPLFRKHDRRGILMARFNESRTPQGQSGAIYELLAICTNEERADFWSAFDQITKGTNA